MQQLNTRLLDKLDISNLELIKAEAELCNSEISKSEEIITNKANTLLQVVMVFITSLIGFVITQIIDGQLPKIFTQVGIIFLVFLSCSLRLLLKAWYPNKNGLSGVMPSNLIDNAIYSDDNENNQKNFYRNRIYSLNMAMHNNLESLSMRVRQYEKSIKLIIVGLIVTIIYCTIYFCLYYYQYFHFSQHK